MQGGYDGQRHFCPPLRRGKTMHVCPTCGLSRDDHLATLLASQTRDLVNSLDRRLRTLQDELLTAIREKGDEDNGRG